MQILVFIFTTTITWAYSIQLWKYLNVKTVNEHFWSRFSSCSQFLEVLSSESLRTNSIIIIGQGTEWLYQLQQRRLFLKIESFIESRHIDSFTQLLATIQGLYNAIMPGIHFVEHFTEAPGWVYSFYCSYIPELHWLLVWGIQLKSEYKSKTRPLRKRKILTWWKEHIIYYF